MTGWTSTIAAQNNYTYNDAGQRLQNDVSGTAPGTRSEVYTYDDLSRLKTVNYGDGQNQTYSFDAMGNRLSKADTVGGGTTTESYTYDAANKLLTRGSQSYTYDSEYNTLSDGTRTNSWDSENRLVQCVTGSGASQTTSTFTYGYDGLRRKMLVQVGNDPNTAQFTETQYVIDGNNVAQELVRSKIGTAGSWTTTTVVNYLAGLQGPIARTTSVTADARYYLFDGLSSVVGEADVNGVVQSAKRFDVYGATRASTGTAKSKQGWVGGFGHQSDPETGYTYMRARYYDPAAGRFANEDPKKDGNNWFGYCCNDPVNKIDESGHAGIDWVIVSILMYITFGAMMSDDMIYRSGG